MRRLDRQEHHADAVLSHGRQRESEISTLTREKLVGNLNQNTSAIAGLRVTAASATVRKVDQDLQSFEDDLVRLFARNVDHEADTTIAVLVSGAIHSLSDWKP